MLYFFVMTLLFVVNNPAAETTKTPAVERGIAAAYPKDQGIRKDPVVIYATGFELDIEAPLKVGRDGVLVLKSKQIAHQGQACAQITATKNVDEGGDLAIQWPAGVEECYLRVYVRFDQDTLMPHHFINLGGHTPTYKYRWGGGAGLKPPSGKSGAFSTTLEPPKGEKGAETWKFYSYWHEMHSWQTPTGISDGRPNAYYGNNFHIKQHSPLVRDQWICLEIMLKLNTVGKHDGEQAVWINGQKRGHWKQGSPNGTWLRGTFYAFDKYNQNPQPFEGFNWRTTDALKINKASLQWYLSNNASWPKMKVDKNMVYFDDLVIATKYIGPME